MALDLIASDALPPKLSDFRFFNGARPNSGVRPYALNTPLFSDYAEKDRYLYLPPGTKATFTGEGLPELPVGAALIKTFRYGASKVETRVLLHRASGWVALPYVWQGDDAVLKRAGTRVALIVDVGGQKQAIDYAVPNVNQCKECHALGDAMTPIGPKARNLTPGMLGVTGGGVRLPKWGDTGAPLEARARAYLDVNCGHCHNPKGAASNSGLNLTWETTDRTALGIGKTPVAAGRGSGGFLYAIDPGHPERSIMVHRMATAEPGVAMPEVGRALVHKEGVKLVSDWIAGMKHE
ncbi:SO2930 family diheme c-type cytochrome [Sphingomonas sp. SUN039]|uniref:SO2930 family diheme c-type cytochrome n=1 Tax=Sphingomonas sp. SUN039 TaxID=2937787 RepID=UPI002164A401|nr:SO2930 family diheme c-type cytochrome [Sphingomonas sp. SUN039]UVO55716.1 hypothetical protein M0209_16950 [Sphingomonas sp. SUN039]